MADITSGSDRDWKQKKHDQVPTMVESAMSSAVFHRNWSRLIQKIYHIYALVGLKCQGAMKVISLI